MSIRVKVASSPKELNDVYRLRYQVYAKEGYFKDQPSNIIVDQFDTLPQVANIIAYSGDTPVGTIRANVDSELKLPSDEMYDFDHYRQQINQKMAKQGRTAKFGSAGMLAIAEPWRNRRDVFRAMFKMCCDIAYSWQVTHIISTVNVKTATMYNRLRFEPLCDPIWIEEIGESIVPLVNDFEPVYQWAFGALSDKSELLKSFSGCFQCLLISAGSEIFAQDSHGQEAYLITKGIVNISQSDPSAHETLSLATLSRGDMFGELSLIDDQPRSATATAVSNTELIVLDSEAFWHKVNQDPQYLRGLLKILTKRLRDVDRRAFIYAHGSVNARLNFFLNKVLEHAVQSVKNPDNWVAKITLEAFCHMASAPHEVAHEFLLKLQQDNRLKLGAREITFYGNEPI